MLSLAQNHLIDEVELQNTIIEERNLALEQIKDDMREVNNFMKEAAILINDQSSSTDTIQEHISSSYDSVNNAIKDIKQAEVSQEQSNTYTLWIAISTVVIFGTAITTAVFLL